MTLQSDFQKLEPGGLIHLYELDASSYGVGILRFHGHQQMESIFWQGQEFEAISLDVSGLEMRSDGKASAPTLTIANNLNGIQGAISAYCLQCKDFVGAKLKVITTLTKYLDAKNFPEGNPTASNESKE
ncbi:phage minor tail protein L, partial [Acinetobacter baumannii]